LKKEAGWNGIAFGGLQSRRPEGGGKDAHQMRRLANKTGSL